MPGPQLSDHQRDSHALALSMTAILVVFFVGSAAHNGLYHELRSATGPNPVGIRLLSDGCATLVMVLLTWVLAVARQISWVSATPRLLLAALFAAFIRAWSEEVLGVLPGDALGLWLAELALGVFYLLGAALLGFAYMLGRRRVRTEEREVANERLQRELALTSLGDEEVRVRRSVAEGLHGGLQQRLVIQVVRLDSAIERARAHNAPDDDVAHLVRVREDLDLIREYDVREMSRMLFPEGIEVGLVPALRSLLRRLPTGIATRLEVSPEFRRMDDPTSSAISESERLLLVRIVEEAITNGLRHGHASAIEVWVALDGLVAVVDVVNDGRALDGDRPSAQSGMTRLAQRFELAGGSVELGNLGEIRTRARDPGAPDSMLRGVVVSARLPLKHTVPVKSG